MGRLSQVSCALLLLAGAAACTKVQARTPPPAAPPPMLTTPTPPDPLVVPVAIVERQPVPTPEPAPPVKPASPATSRPGDRATPPVTPPPAPVVPDPPPPQALQTTADVSEIEGKARESIRNATRDLEKINRDSLGKDAREQFDNAQRMINVAKTALTSRNFLFAREMAGKAAAMASLLVKG